MAPRSLLALLALALVVGADMDLSRPHKVPLADGSRVVGRIVKDECTDKLCVVRELRGGRKRVIPWSGLESAMATKLRIALGFEVAVQKSGMQVDAVEVKTRAGVRFVGKLENPDSFKQDGEYRLKTAEGPRRIRLRDVVEGPTSVSVSALTIYKPLELYKLRLAEKAPQTAQDHFRLAEFARTMGALEPAKMHYEKVKEMADPQYPAATIDRLLDRVNKRIGNKEAEDALRTVRQHIHYNRFAKAAAGLEAFVATYGEDEDFAKGAESVAADLKKKRDDYFTLQVPIKMRDAVRDRLAKRVKEADEEFTIRHAMKYAGGEVSDEKSVSSEAVAEVAEKTGLTAEEIIDYWKLRKRRTWFKAFFRDGTFIVVENLEDALAKAPKPKKSGKGPKTTVKPPKPTPANKPDNWWKHKVNKRNFSDLRDWMYAFWAENSGLVELDDPKLELCPTCAGKGWVASSINTGQGTIPFYNRCQTCYMAKKFRVVRFR